MPYKSAYTGEEIDEAIKKTQNSSNPNLLDNWYFVGGGSQQGGGQFPINQQGKKEYNATHSYNYGIDRWALFGVTGEKVRLSDNGIAISTNYSSDRYVQKIENGHKFNNKTLTFSVLARNPESIMGISLYNRTTGFISKKNAAETSSKFVVLSITDTLPINENDEFQVLIYPKSNTSDETISKEIEVMATKLELGSQQTLAHKEGDTWILNEVPDYVTELAKCQRYYQVFETKSLCPQKAQDFRPSMRANPTFSTIQINETTFYTADANL